MNFSQRVKQELLHTVPEKHCCMLSELSALTQTVGSLMLMGRGRIKVVFRTENTDLAKRIFQLLQIRMQITAQVEYHALPRFGGRQECMLTVPESDSLRLLSALHMMRPGEGEYIYKGVPRAAIGRKCCRQAFLRGAFLGSGSMQDPSAGYRMEITLPNPDRADTILKVMEKSGIHGYITERRGATVVYIKKGDDIVTMLAQTGAHNCLMEMENIRIRRGSLGQVNRALNCDNANIGRQLTAGDGQAKAITDYSLNHSLAGLSRELGELARSRMLNPDLSLEQLGQMLNPPVTKSAVNYRMRKLMKIIKESHSPEGDEGIEDVYN